MSFWKDLGNIAASVVGYAIGGPIGAVAGGSLASNANNQGWAHGAVEGAGIAGAGSLFSSSGLLDAFSGSSAAGGGASGGSSAFLNSGGIFGSAPSWYSESTMFSDPLLQDQLGGFGGFGGTAGTAGAAGGTGTLDQIMAMLKGAAGGAGSSTGGGSLFDTLRGLYGLNTASSLLSAGRNPVVGYQPGWASQLNSLVNSPAAIVNDPGYKFQLEQGRLALDRRMAAGGYTPESGNYGTALTEYGQNFANQYYQQRLGQLAGLTQAGQAAGGTTQSGALAAMLSGSSINSLGYGLGF